VEQVAWFSFPQEMIMAVAWSIVKGPDCSYQLVFPIRRGHHSGMDEATAKVPGHRFTFDNAAFARVSKRWWMLRRLS